MPEDAFKLIIRRIAAGETLDKESAETAFEALMSGGAAESQIGAFLLGLHMRGESVEEISAAVRVLRRHMVRIAAPPEAIDVCGTGGDGAGTWNISTAAALVAAGAGAKIAKHGNRALSSLSGSAEVLEVLGVNTAAPPETISRAIKEAGIGFMFAPAHHPAMKHVGAARAALGIRTIFNLAGPLCNPAGVKRQLAGVFAEKWLLPAAEVLAASGAERALIVHGSDGLDEITTTGASKAADLRDGKITLYDITPEDAGLPRASPDALKGGSPKENAAAIKALLAGEKSAFRDIVCLNAGAALMVAGLAQDLSAGVVAAQNAIDEGRAAAALTQLAEISQA